MWAKKVILSACLILTMPVVATEIITVTGSRIDDGILAGQASLSRQQIEQIKATSTLQLLRHLPNVQISQNGDAGGHSFVSIRGGESNFTLVLIDGVVVNDPTNSRGGGFDFSLINVAAIERIDVYRGGVSVAYGGDAISGVIHIKTRKDDNNSIRLELGEEQKNISGTFGHHWGKQLTTLINASVRDQQGRDPQEINTQQLLFKLDKGFQGSQVSALVNFSQQDSKAFAEDSGGNIFASPNLPENRQQKQWIASLSGIHQASETTTIKTQLAWSKIRDESVHPGIEDGVLSGIPASNIQTQYEKWDFEVQASTELSTSLTGLAGISARRATGENSGFLDFGFMLPVDFELKQDIDSAFVEINYKKNQLSINAGVRYDNPQGFADETSVRLKGQYQLTDNWYVSSAYHQGYKLPSFFALAHPLVGNLALLPERATNIDLALNFINHSGHQMLQHFYVQIFDNEFKDLVDFDPELFTSVNRSLVNSKGLELSASLLPFSWLTLDTHLTYTDVSVEQQSQQLRRRPKWFGGIAAFMHINNTWSAELDASYKSEFLDSSIPTGVLTLPGYARVNASLNWQYNDQFLSYVAIENVFNKRYQDSIGFLLPDSSVRLGLNYTW
jgi:iron complex outermembrane receptor protein/vitamin B12 transporter